MYKTLLSLFLNLLPAQVAYATSYADDTLSTAYTEAVDHWLFGRTDKAERALRQLATGVESAERSSSRQLLLDELYFWPGHYTRYLHLADSMNSRTDYYDVATLLATQPTPQYQLLADSVQIPFRLRHGAHAVVTVFINRQPVRLALDSGAQRTIISNRVAKRLSVNKLADMQLQNYFGESVPSTLSTVDSLQLDGVTITNLPVICASMSIPGIDGLLGWDILRQFALVIDYPKRQLTLRRSVPHAAIQANLLGGSRPMLLLRSASGRQLNFFLDTGSNEKLRVSPTGLTKIGPYNLGHKLSIGGAVGRLVRIALEKHVKQVVLGINGVQRRFRRVTLDKADEVIGQVIKGGLIGGATFRKGRLTLDAPNHSATYTE